MTSLLEQLLCEREKKQNWERVKGGGWRIGAKRKFSIRSRKRKRKQEVGSAGVFVRAWQ